MKSISYAALAILFSVTALSGQATQQTPQAPSTLPGGATQVQETHGDWRVTCAQPGGRKVCTLSQQLSDPNSRQLVIGIELKAMTSDKADGTMVMPFGLAVDKPVSLQVDDSGPAMTRTFRTCVPIGCLVDVTLDGTTLAALKKGKALHVKALADGGKETAFNISLNGFGSALERTAALSK